jgi:CheY-like chemotaxis protein
MRCQGEIKESNVPEAPPEEPIVKGSILLVDGEEMILDVGEQILKTMGYKVLMARSGKEAIEIVSKTLPSSTPDLIILDMIMPVIGVERPMTN